MLSNQSEYHEIGSPNSGPRRWLVHRSPGPVMATAVHAGHEIRSELHPYLKADDDARRREEDPATDIWASVADNIFVSYKSRFEVDLNRSKEMACATRAEDTWGMQVWREAPPSDMLDRSLEQHSQFYNLMREWLESMIARHGKVLLLDIHSYNHRRDGPNAKAAPADRNPEIDLGLTTLDQSRFGRLADSFAQALRDEPCQGRKPDVRGNVRYPDGGNWPEWVYANYGEDVCTITLEYKKFYMDEWTGHISLPVVEDLRAGLSRAVDKVREELAQCR